MPSDILARLTAALADRYKIEREVGAGGMATVYLAEDVRHRRKVAVKVLRPELAATLGSDRFFREIEVAAQLQHPHILPLLDSGEAEGFYYYVMPYVAGESLRERLAKERELPIHDAVKILVEVVDALAAAHAMGVVHRDIKPDNVMISGRHAMVTDFGVAKAVSEATGRHQLTTAGVALGTPAYMAPEQAAADPHIDQRVDIYAVGAMAYELLTGRPPFAGGTPAEVLAAHVTRIPEAVTTHRAACPPALAAVIMRCLEKRPADRWQSAEELLTQLEPLATPSGGMTPTQTRPVEAISAGGSRKLLGLSAVLIAVVVVTALMVSRTRTHAPIVLRDRTQITFNGGVSGPAMSPDGRQLAYVSKRCTVIDCTYGIELEDIGGTATRRVFDGASALYFLEWSGDRRSLLFLGSINTRFGFYLISTLGGEPRFVSPFDATFWAGGDSLLISSNTHLDSAFYVSVAGLDGKVTDSIRIAGQGDFGSVGTSVPGTRWFVVAFNKRPLTEIRMVDRLGREGGSVAVRGAFTYSTASGDALWVWAQHADDPRSSALRFALDTSTGELASEPDTVYVGLFTRLSVTADGSSMVVDEGTYGFDVWTLSMQDALKGDFRQARNMAHATSALGGVLSPDGTRIAVLQDTDAGAAVSVMTVTDPTDAKLTVRGATPGMWLDSVTLSISERSATGTQLSLLDVRNGDRRNVLPIQDSLLQDFAPLGDSGWIWIPIGRRSIQVHDRPSEPTRVLPKPDWYRSLVHVTATRDGKLAAVTGWDTKTNDSLGIFVVTLPEGKETPWTTLFGEEARPKYLDDGTLLVTVYLSQEIASLMHLRGPGALEFVGTIPRRVDAVTISRDRRVVGLTTVDYRGDAWMSRVVRPE